MRLELFGKFADRYDWHTPPHHYHHDHAFVLSCLPPLPCRILDAGCGTGVFLQKALEAGIDAIGIDASPEMVAISSRRVGNHRVRLENMLDFKETCGFDAIVSLSWSFNYVGSFHEAEDVLRLFFNALRPGGRLILQIAHAGNAMGALYEDREQGPTGEAGDVLFLYRFCPSTSNEGELRAQYVFGCRSRNELMFEEHRLCAADAPKVSELARTLGFKDIELLESWRGEPFKHAIMPFLLASRPL